MGAVQIHQGLSEKLLVAAKIAFYLKREERACDHIEGLCGTSLQGHGFPEVPPSTELHFQCLGPGREEVGTRDSHGGSRGVVVSDGPVPSFGPMRGAHAEIGRSHICGCCQHHSGDHPACLCLSLTSCRLLSHKPPRSPARPMS